MLMQIAISQITDYDHKPVANANFWYYFRAHQNCNNKLITSNHERILWPL